MIDNTVSRKIKVLSSVAMVAVVMIHSHALGTFERPAPWCLFLQTFLFRAITSWAVPFFFVVSGYFFAKCAYFAQGGGGVRSVHRKESADIAVAVFALDDIRYCDIISPYSGQQLYNA